MFWYCLKQEPDFYVHHKFIWAFWWQLWSNTYQSLSFNFWISSCSSKCDSFYDFNCLNESQRIWSKKFCFRNCPKSKSKMFGSKFISIPAITAYIQLFKLCLHRSCSYIWIYSGWNLMLRYRFDFSSCKLVPINSASFIHISNH